MNSICFVDAYNLFMRTFSTVVKFNSKMYHTGAIYGTMQTLSSLSKKYDHIVMIWDGQDSGVIRRKIFPEYKQGRRAKHHYMAGVENLQSPFTEDVNTQAHFDYQYNTIQEMLKYTPIYNISIYGLEADDVIAYLALHERFSSFKKIIFSSDKDYIQLLRKDNNVRLEKKLNQFRTYNNVLEEFGVLPENFSIARAIVGDDKGDGIIGVKGVGFKTLVKIFPEIGKTCLQIDDVFHILENREKRTKHEQLIIDNLEQIYKMYSIIDLQHIDLQFRKVDEIWSNIKLGIDWKPLLFKMMIIREEITTNNLEYSSFINNFSNKKPLILEG